MVVQAAFKTSGNIVSDLISGLSKVIGGVSNGLELIAREVGNTLNQTSTQLAITSTKVIRNAGGLAPKTARTLGNVIQVIPILGIHGWKGNKNSFKPFAKSFNVKDSIWYLPQAGTG